MCTKVATITISFWLVIASTIISCRSCHAFQSNHNHLPFRRRFDGPIIEFLTARIHHDESSTATILRMVAKPNKNAPRKSKPLIFSPVKRKAPLKPVFLTHERECFYRINCNKYFSISDSLSSHIYCLKLFSIGDFFRQVARLESMDSYVLVSTLTSSMSFGCLLGFTPSTATKALLHIQSAASKYIYRNLCLTIPVVAGLSAIFGLYAAIIFSLTILYGKSALGAERDVEYDDFIRATARARVHGFRCFSLSLGIFALEAVLVLIERTFFRVLSLPVMGLTGVILYKLWQDWTLLIDSAEIIYQ